MPKDPELSEVLLEARRKLHSKFLSSLKQVEEKGLTWEDLDLDTVAWTVLMIVENGPQKYACSGNEINYADIAKVICRIVFPPGILTRLQNEEREE